MSDHGSEHVAGGRTLPIAPPNGWVDTYTELPGPTGAEPRTATAGSSSPSLPHFFRSIGDAVRLAIAPGEIDAAYRITNVSRGRDRELWVVESRFGPR